jgi:hypothetical protein
MPGLRRGASQADARGLRVDYSCLLDEWSADYVDANAGRQIVCRFLNLAN